MRTYIQLGDAITVPAPVNVAADGIVAIRSIFGFAHGDALAGEPVVVAVEGVFERTVTAAADVELGAPVYYDETAGTLTTDDAAGANREIGFAIAAAAAVDGAATVRVKLLA